MRPRPAARARKRMSSTRVDFPEPLTPLTTVSVPRGMDTSMPRRLCSRAPRMRSVPVPARRGFGHRHHQLAPQVPAGEASVQRGGGSLVHEAPALAPGALAEVDHVVGGADRLRVVLDDHHGVAEIADGHEGAEKPLVVPLVQPHRWLVQDVDDALQAGADLTGQPYPVRLARGQGGGRSIQGQVPDAHSLQEPEALDDVGQDPVRHRPLPVGERQRAQRGRRFARW